MNKKDKIIIGDLVIRKNNLGLDIYVHKKSGKIKHACFFTEKGTVALTNFLTTNCIVSQPPLEPPPPPLEPRRYVIPENKDHDPTR